MHIRNYFLLDKRKVDMTVPWPTRSQRDCLKSRTKMRPKPRSRSWTLLDILMHQVHEQRPWKTTPSARRLHAPAAWFICRHNRGADFLLATDDEIITKLKNRTAVHVCRRTLRSTAATWQELGVPKAERHIVIGQLQSLSLEYEWTICQKDLTDLMTSR